MLGEALKQARKEVPFTQARVAKRAKISLPTVRLLESGRGNLTSFAKVVKALGLSICGKNPPAGDSIGERVAMLRKRRSMSHRTLALQGKVSHPVIVRLERHGRGRLSVLDNRAVF